MIIDSRCIKGMMVTIIINLCIRVLSNNVSTIFLYLSIREFYIINHTIQHRIMTISTNDIIIFIFGTSNNICSFYFSPFSKYTSAWMIQSVINFLFLAQPGDDIRSLSSGNLDIYNFHSCCPNKVQQNQLKTSGK